MIHYNAVCYVDVTIYLAATLPQALGRPSARATP